MTSTGAPRIGRGRPLPLGARIADGGADFALFSRHATAVELLLYDASGAAEPAEVVALDPSRHRTGDIWHVWVGGVAPGQVYAYRVDGPSDDAAGLRFDRRQVLLDPCASALCGTSRVPRCVVVESNFDWGDDRPPRRSWSQTIIYETHVRGLTIHPSAGVAQPGTFAGLTEKIPYFLELGVTAVELLPVQAYLPATVRRYPGRPEQRRTQYWGYEPIALYAPHESYAAASFPGSQVDEFKHMVKRLHAAGIEVILDVVFTHTGEGDEFGPTLSYRGLDNPVYYMLLEGGSYADYSGCGNTLNCNHPVVRDHIVNCLRTWVTEMRVDGFRFDLAAIMERDEHGRMLTNPPLLHRLVEDPVLRDVKLIAEAWDAAGAYQLGSFGSRRWSEWNGRFRDDVRRFWRGDRGTLGSVASRLCGSADLYQRSGKEPLNSINFVACHDGFTLNDVVSYACKHNEMNGEGNRDGALENYSDNYGVEGPTDDPTVASIRTRQIKNMIATLMLSRGVPMLSGGDEFRRTQRGNNNAYCQDNEVSWYDWASLRRARESFEFTRRMIALRGRYPTLRDERFFEEGDILWFDARGRYPDWDAGEPLLGYVIRAKGGDADLCLVLNAAADTRTVAAPAELSAAAWRVIVDTSSPAPFEIAEDSGDALVTAFPLRVHGRSLLVLERD